jgi:hypothetical protein
MAYYLVKAKFKVEPVQKGDRWSRIESLTKLWN